jgi:hypothetical protein
MPLIETVVQPPREWPKDRDQAWPRKRVACTACKELLPDLVHVHVEVHEVRPWRKNSVQNNSVGLCRVELEVAQNVVGGVGTTCHEDLLARLTRKIDEAAQIAGRLGGAEEGESVSPLLAHHLAAGRDEIRGCQTGFLLIGTGERFGAASPAMVRGVHVKVGMFCGVKLHEGRETIGGSPARPPVRKPHLAARGLGGRAQALDVDADGARHSLAVVERQGHGRTLGETVALALDERTA